VGLIFVNGVPGVGKSTVCEELRRRGFLARDTDAPGMSGWIVLATGEWLETRVDARERDAEFSRDHEWAINMDEVLALAATAARTATNTFLCGSVANEDGIWDAASKVIHLQIDDDTMRRRLATRVTSDYGKSDGELKLCLEWNHRCADEDRARGATVIDATRPLDEVVGDILRISCTSPRAGAGPTGTV